MSTGLVVCLHPALADPAHPLCLPSKLPLQLFLHPGRRRAELLLGPGTSACDYRPHLTAPPQLSSLPHKQAPNSQAEFSKGLAGNPWFLFLPEEILPELELLNVMTAAATLAPSLFLFPRISLMVARCARFSSG